MVAIQPVQEVVGDEQAVTPRDSYVISLVAMAADIALVLALGVTTDFLYHLAFRGEGGSYHGVWAAVVVVVVFTVLQLTHGAYRPNRLLERTPHYRSARQDWITTFFVLLVFTFLTKDSAAFSRGASILFFVLGFPLLFALRRLLHALFLHAARHERVRSRRLVIVGARRDIEAYCETHLPWAQGIETAALLFIDDSAPEAPPTMWLREQQRMLPLTSMDLVLPQLRRLEVEDVLLVIPTSEAERIERYVQLFLPLPGALYLAPEPLYDRLVARLGRRLIVSRALVDDLLGLGAIPLVRAPMSRVDRAVKRAFDLVASSVALVLLSPLLAAVAIAIKLDSRGPVLFCQQRHGFNETTFEILKFRSMTTGGERGFRQATKNDARVTRVGRFIRRTSIDELPQLFNVLRGDMSLVGPRPHAVLHNSAYMHKIADYARRHHVKPGITGWAQVNGYRGETDTDEKMRMRVNLDQAYIEKWSLLFDLWILVLTVFSPRTYRNAY